eukprot:2509926-Amphidinium_carterae.1
MTSRKPLFFQSTYVIQQTHVSHGGGQGYQGHQPMELDQINGFKGEKGKYISQHRGHGKGKSSLAGHGKPGFTISASGNVQLDATDSEQPPLELRTIMMDQ